MATATGSRPAEDELGGSYFSHAGNALTSDVSRADECFTPRGLEEIRLFVAFGLGLGGALESFAHGDAPAGFVG